MVIVSASASRIETRSVEPPRQHQLKFEAFNETYDLTLQPSTGLFSPHFTVILRDENSTQTSPASMATKCFYRGKDAAFDLCKGVVRIILALLMISQF